MLRCSVDASVCICNPNQNLRQPQPLYVWRYLLWPIEKYETKHVTEMRNAYHSHYLSSIEF